MREQGLLFQKLDRQPMDLQGRLRHIAFRVEITMECFAGREPVEELDATNLDQAISGKRIEPGGFGI
jgi:hypothetical protein